MEIKRIFQPADNPMDRLRKLQRIRNIEEEIYVFLFAYI